MNHKNLATKILYSIEKFDLNLNSKKVLTEAATGNFVITPVIAATAGAEVIAITKDSKYGTVKEVLKQTNILSKILNVEERITITEDLESIDLASINILTNTGFNRPITKVIIDQLSSKCVIPLMWEPWEYREDDLDLEACFKKGIKVYGTNESDPRLKTMDYIGYIVLYFLLDQKLSPFSAKILNIGCEKYVNPISKILKQNNYNFQTITDFKKVSFEIDEYNAIIIAENSNDMKIIGNETCFINSKEILEDTVVIHIAGNVDFSNGKYFKIPEKPAKFGHMSFTTDYVDNMAVIDLHTAGLKVAEGMLKTNELNLYGIKYKKNIEFNYPALAFKNEKYW